MVVAGEAEGKGESWQRLLVERAPEVTQANGTSIGRMVAAWLISAAGNFSRASMRHRPEQMG